MILFDGKAIQSIICIIIYCVYLSYSLYNGIDYRYTENKLDGATNY